MDVTRFLILTVSFACLASLALATKGYDFEEPKPVEDLDKFGPTLKSALSGLNRKFDIVRIAKATKQESIVSNEMKYKVSFINRNRRGTFESCHASWIEGNVAQPQDLEVQCENI